MDVGDKLSSKFSTLELDEAFTPPLTGFVYSGSFNDHFEPEEEECPERISGAFEHLNKNKSLSKCKIIHPRKSKRSELLLVHEECYVEYIESSKTMSPKELLTAASRFEGVFFTNTTFEAASTSCGSVIELVDNVVLGNVQNGFALIRTPGHHAEPYMAGGYCYFNNVAIAAKHAIQEHKLKRILIVDFDVHHGQGTQNIFLSSKEVLFVSLHQYEHAQFYPRMEEADFNVIGIDEGKGYNINIPWNTKKCGDSEYLAAFLQLILPIAYEFCPELVLVSAGFDCCSNDPLGDMNVTPSCLAHIIHLLMGLANGKVVVVNEGGYNFSNVAIGTNACLNALKREPLPRITIGAPNHSSILSILNAIDVLSSFWQSLQFQNIDQEPRKEKNRFVLLRDGQVDIGISDNVGYVYDDAMTLHQDIVNKGHPECPERILRINEYLEASSILKQCKHVQIDLTHASKVNCVHDQSYIEKFQSYMKVEEEEMCNEYISHAMKSLYYNRHTLQSANVAAAGLISLVDDVLKDKLRNGFANIRPPGHHAEHDSAFGFCFFNNVAFAAQYALDHFDLKKVLILDWDVHHGNGTQNMFESDPRVLYISLHRFRNFFPGGDGGSPLKVGKGDGEGYNMNIGWENAFADTSTYISAFLAVVLPVCYEYNPDLILISCGFDSAKGDPLGGQLVSTKAFGLFTHWMKAFANGRVVVALEGGYNFDSISRASASCIQSLLGFPVPKLKPTALRKEIPAIERTLDAHRVYWKQLTFRKPLPGVEFVDWPRPYFEYKFENSDGLAIDEKPELDHPDCIPFYRRYNFLKFH